MRTPSALRQLVPSGGCTPSTLVAQNAGTVEPNYPGLNSCHFQLCKFPQVTYLLHTSVLIWKWGC